HDGAPDEDAEICLSVLVHAAHEPEHDDGHGRSHDQRHVDPCFTEEDLVELVRVQIHQPEHGKRGCRDHGEESCIAVHGFALCTLTCFTPLPLSSVSTSSMAASMPGAFAAASAFAAVVGRSASRSGFAYRAGRAGPFGRPDI